MHLTAEELAELTPAERKAHLENEERLVFGHDFKRDAQGRPIEQGIGAPGNTSHNHFKALQIAEGADVAARAQTAAGKTPR